MWLNIASKLVPGIIKTGMSIASNRRRTKELESVAELKLAEKMANGEVEYKKAVIDSHRGDLKDEFLGISYKEYNISDYFKETFFMTKKVIHIGY